MDPLQQGFDMSLSGTNYLSRIIPRFHMRAVYLEEESEKAGHAVYRDYPYVEMITPGDRRSVPCIRVREEHKKFWKKEWEAFESGTELIGEGRPLGEWAVMPGSMVKMLKTINIQTVEQLATCQLDNIKGFGPGFVKMRELAIKFIEENDTKQEQIDELKDQNAALLERLAALEESMKAKTTKRPQPVKPQPKKAPKKEDDAKNSSGDSE